MVQPGPAHNPANAPIELEYMSPPSPAMNAHIEWAPKQPAAPNPVSPIPSHPHTPSPSHPHTPSPPKCSQESQSSSAPGPSSPVRHQLQDNGPESESPEMGPGLNDVLSTDPNSYYYGIHQMHGALRQRWLDDPNAPHCTVQGPELDFAGLINNPNPRERWIVSSTRWGAAPGMQMNEVRNLGLPTGDNDYRHVRIQKPGVHPTRGTGQNEYLHYNGRGVIFAVHVERFSGPHWSQIALAQYTFDFPIDTLRYIFIQNVINDDTKLFFYNVLYAQRNVLPFDTMRNTSAEIPVAWIFGTPEYQGILGTTFGKGVCALLISAFPRGTHRIARILSWKHTLLQLRFDIEETPNLQSG